MRSSSVSAMPGTRSEAFILRYTRSGLDLSHHIDVVTCGLRIWVTPGARLYSSHVGVKSDFKSTIEGMRRSSISAVFAVRLSRVHPVFDLENGMCQAAFSLIRNFPFSFLTTQMACTSAITPEA